MAARVWLQDSSRPRKYWSSSGVSTKPGETQATWIGELTDLSSARSASVIGADRELGRRVESAGRRHAVAAHRGDVDDAAAAGGEVFERELAAECERHHVDPPHFLPVGGVAVDDPREVGDARAVHQAVDFSESLEDRGNLLALGQVGERWARRIPGARRAGG